MDFLSCSARMRRGCPGCHALRMMRVARLAPPVLILLACGVYGAADQYLGSRVQLGEWTVAVSQMSAPWLALAFVAGAWSSRRAQAVTMGAAITYAALAGYVLMMLSPIEGVTPSSVDWLMELRSQLHVLLPAAFTGPLFGWLGWRWRHEQSLLPALLPATLFALEPIARTVAGQQIDARSLVWPMEAAIGAALAGMAVAFRRVS